MTTIRPLNDWLLVRCEKIPEKIGAIIVPNGTRVRTGEVLAAGPGRFYKDQKARTPVDVSVGDRVAFFRETLETQQGKQIVSVLHDIGDDIGLIRATDVLFVIPPGVKVDLQ